jgi:hypothetical protein
MGLIIKNKIQKLLKGFPTVSDKYNVQGGLLGGASAGKFGDVLVFTSTQGEYAVASSVAAASDVAGILLGTNVKLAMQYPAGASYEVTTAVGEAINLMLNGFVAVELENPTVAEMAEGKGVAITAAGKLTTADVASSIALPKFKFTGVYENHGTEAAPVYVAEIQICC